MILCIFGAGGQGKEVKEIAELDNKINGKWNEIIFIDDYCPEGQLMGIRRLHFNTVEKEYSKTDVEFVIALGEPSTKKKIFEMIQKKGFNFGNVICPESQISSYANLGKGLIVKRGVLISPEAMVQDNTTLQAYVAVGHNVKIGKHCQVATHSVIGGGTQLGECVYVGLNCPIREQLIIGDNAVISAGAVVLKNVESGVTVMGNPARVIAKNNGKSSVFSSTKK